MLNFYFHSDLSMEEIAQKLGVTRQAVSFHVVRAIKKRGIKFYVRHIFQCNTCGSEIEVVKKEKKCKARKNIERIVYHKQFKCIDCVRNNLVRAGCCGTVGFKDEFYPRRIGFVCGDCNRKRTHDWMTKNRDRWNLWQREWRKKKKNKEEPVLTPAPPTPTKAEQL